MLGGKLAAEVEAARAWMYRSANLHATARRERVKGILLMRLWPRPRDDTHPVPHHVYYPFARPPIVIGYGTATACGCTPSSGMRPYGSLFLPLSLS